jgi:hypothetical protein
VLEKMLSSKILIADDFNEQLSKFARKSTARGFRGIIPDVTLTHASGNHLDQIFSNIEVAVEQLP